MPYLEDVHGPALSRAEDLHCAPQPTKQSVTLCEDSAQRVTQVPSEKVIGSKDGIMYLEKVVAIEREVVEMEGLEYASRPPSPPQSGTSTPRLNIAPCPSRLKVTVPPPNYGVIKRGAVFRSAFPQDRNLGFLRGLRVKTILCLVDTLPGAAYNLWVEDSNIRRHHVNIAANKEGKIKTTWDSICEALLIMMDAANYPLYVHCNQGRHRTGCVVACLRKVQRWPMEDIIAEYEAYSSPKMRSADEDFVQSFDPEAVFEYAQKTGCFDDRPFMRRMDSVIVDVDSLARALSFNDYNVDDLAMNFSTISSSSIAKDDHGLEMVASIATRGRTKSPVHGSVTDVKSGLNDTAHVPALENASECGMVIEDVLESVAWDGDTSTTVLELSELDRSLN